MPTKIETLTKYYNNTHLTPEQLKEISDFITNRNGTMFTMPENCDMRLIVEWEEFKQYVKTGKK